MSARPSIQRAKGGDAHRAGLDTADEPPAPDLRGLTDAEVLARRRAGHGNRAAPAAGRGYVRIVIESAFAPVNVVLFGTCLVLGGLGLGVDALVTAVPVLLNVLASVALESRAKRRLDRLTILSRPGATVIRNGREAAVRSEELVLGDLLIVGRGDEVLLDGEVLDGAVDLDESLLTGEAEPVTRRAGERILSGAACLGGRAVIRITAVGASSYAAALVRRAREARPERTPLQRDLARLVGGSAAAVLAVGLVVAIDLWGAGRLVSREAVQAGAVLVAIVPQGLVIVATLLYARAAVAMTRAGALIQRVNAVEAMSRADTLVLDKTGTLTTGRLRLVRLEPVAQGAHAEARLCLTTLAAESSFTDRTTEAIRAWLSTEQQPSEIPVITDRVAFASDRRWSAVLTAEGSVVLGAADALLPAGASLVDSAERSAALGLRVLLLAAAPSTASVGSPGDAEASSGDRRSRLPSGLRPVALIGFEEELRADARATLAGLTADGLRLKIASGDHRATVAAIAAQMGIPTGEPIDARTLAQATDADLADAAERGTVFGRVEPGLKARLVVGLRRGGHTVAMIGDGVNDIIALRSANLGVAMASGSPAARSAADVVLLRDEFAVLPRTIAAGQRIVEGMRLVACLLFTRTVSALLLVLGASIVGLDFPVTPRTNSLQALLTVGIPSLVIAGWAPAVPARTNMVRSAVRFAVPAGVAIAALGVAVYWAWPRAGSGPDVARAATVALTTWCGILLIPFLLPPGPGRDARPTMLAAAMAVTFGIVLAVPALRGLFELDALTIPEIVTLALIGAAWAAIASRVRSMGLVALAFRAIRRRFPSTAPASR